MQTITLGIKDDYFDKFTALLDALPKGAVSKVETGEVEKRVQEYKSGTIKTVPFEDGLDDMRAKLLSKCK